MIKSFTYISYLVRKLNPPHFIKYLYYLVLKGRTVKVRSNISNTKFQVDLNIGNFIDYWIFMDGAYESRWITFFRKQFKSGTFIDVGAHLGNHSLSLADRFDCIYAFEPERKNFYSLNKAVKANKVANIEVIRQALSDHSGIAKLHTHKTENCGHSLVLDYHGRTQTITLETLDRFIFRRKIKNIKLVKIDVEGAELSVLRGTAKLIKKFHPQIFLELNKPVLESVGSSVDAIYNFLTDLGYCCYRLSGESLKKIGYKEIKNIYYENVLFKREP